MCLNQPSLNFLGRILNRICWTILLRSREHKPRGDISDKEQQKGGEYPREREREKVK